MSARFITLDDARTTKAAGAAGPDGDAGSTPPGARLKRTIAVGSHLVHHLNALRRLTLLFIGVLLAVVVILTAAQLTWTMLVDVFAPPSLFLSLAHLFRILGTFALVLIAVELLDTTLRAYSADVNHADLMIRVAIIAAARHAILTDYENASLQAMLGLAAVLLALTAGAFFMSRVTGSSPARSRFTAS
jgi:uncharacterized membrane protein (DUF373 family)